VNFGTGVVTTKCKGAPDGGRLLWAREIYPRMSALQNKLSARTSKHMFGSGYIRIDADLDGPVELDDARPATLKKMEELAHKAINEDGKPKNDFDRLVELLKV
jgi:hypothetical protein